MTQITSRYLIAILLIPLLFSCGKRMVRTYESDDWNREFYPLTSDSTGRCYVDIENKKPYINVKISYTSSYKTANELINIDASISSGSEEIKLNSEQITANDGDYKLVTGYQNKLTLDRKSSWKNLGTQLHIDTVKNAYLEFRINIHQKFKVKNNFPNEIVLNLTTETTLGKKDTSIALVYKEFEDTSAPIRVH